LLVTVSLTSYDQALSLEPYAPAPDRRIENLRRLADAGIATVVAIRPLLPVVPDDELFTIVDRTKDTCQGYISGPFYFKNLAPELLGDQVADLEQVIVPWMNDQSPWYKLHTPEREQRLARYVEQRAGQRFYEGIVEALHEIKRTRLP
jgi:DNA repair photolyase